MMFRYIRRYMRRKKHERESFNARLKMEQNAQRDVAARLQLMEIKFLNKTRTG